MEHVKLRGLPESHAQAAYDAGFLIEAFLVVHAAIESKLQELMMLIAGTYRGLDSLSHVWDECNKLKLSDAVRTLRILGVLSRDEAAELRRVNSMRNRLVHDMMLEPYGKEYDGVPRPRYDATFKDGLQLLRSLGSRLVDLNDGEHSPDAFARSKFKPFRQ